MLDNDFRQVPSQFTSAFRHFSNLVQGELNLARAEMSQNLSRAGVGIVFFGIAALMALVALNILATAVVAAIADSGVSYSASAAIVGGAILLISLVLSLLGKARLSADALTPKRTIKAVERDISNIKEAANV